MTRRDLRSREALFDFLRTTERDWSFVNLLGIDLESPDIDDALLREEFAERTAFLGCAMSGALARKVASSGALLIPDRPGLPFDSFRGHLYRAEDLFAGYDASDPASYRRTPDWLCYVTAMDEMTKRKRIDLGVDAAVHFRFHDLSVEDALEAYLAAPGSSSPAKRVIGIMGGHDRERAEQTRGPDGHFKDSPYMQAALVARRLARLGFTIATGGGPGAMEASNLGAWFASRSEDDLRAAIRILARVPKVQPKSKGSHEWNSGEWLGPATEVMQRFPRDADDPHTESIGVPTWFYGHEPPNPFASHIAKFFENSIREDGVLGIATHGVIFTEGNAGTVQEIFQDACQNYYRTHGQAAPMVLLGRRYWDHDPRTPDDGGRKTVWPLLRQLGREKAFEHLMLITDDLDEVVAFLATPRPGS